MSQKKLGILISYVNLIANMFVNIFLTPFLINALSDSNYSIYKIIQSFAGPLIMFNLGVSVIVTKCIVSFADGTIQDVKKKQNTMAMAILSSTLMAGMVFVACLVMRGFIPKVYGSNFTPDEIVVAQNVFLIFALAIILQILSDSFLGVILGHKKYVLHSLVTLIKTILKVVLTIVFVWCGFGVVMISLINLIIAAVALLMTVVCSLIYLKEHPHLYYFDKRQFVEIFAYSLAILMQSIVNQVNNSVDNMVLGALVSEKYIITMYSSALIIYATYNSLISAVSSYLLPSAIQLVNRKPSGREYTDFVIRPGRIQAMLGVAVIFAFALFGKDFITLWIGAKYIDAYYVVLMLIIPVTIPLVENAAISVLDATLKRKARSMILCIMALLNVVLTIVLVKMMGFWGAAISTAISLVVGHGLLMNIYYAKQFKMEISRMFFSIFKGILPCGILSTLICYFVCGFIPFGFTGFLAKCSVFLVIYAVFLWLFGMNQYEKDLASGMVKGIKRKLGVRRKQ